jgi:hypothetical protein
MTIQTQRCMLHIVPRKIHRKVLISFIGYWRVVWFFILIQCTIKSRLRDVSLLLYYNCNILCIPAKQLQSSMIGFKSLWLPKHYDLRPHMFYGYFSCIFHPSFGNDWSGKLSHYEAIIKMWQVGRCPQSLTLYSSFYYAPVFLNSFLHLRITLKMIIFWTCLSHFTRLMKWGFSFL